MCCFPRHQHTLKQDKVELSNVHEIHWEQGKQGEKRAYFNLRMPKIKYVYQIWNTWLKAKPNHPHPQIMIMEKQYNKPPPKTLLETFNEIIVKYEQNQF